MENKLQDITNINKRYCNYKKEDGSQTFYNYNRKPRKVLDCAFANESEKLIFIHKLQKIKMDLALSSVKDVISQLMDEYLCKSDSEPTKTQSSVESMDCYGDHESFICTKGQVLVLINELSLGKKEVFFDRKGHVATVQLKNLNDQRIVEWSSSAPLKNDFYLNHYMIHSFLISGMLTSQYERFCETARIGTTTKHFRKTIFPVFERAVSVETEKSTASAVGEDVSVTENGYTEGIGILTDARHACRKNSFHTDVVALGEKTHQIVCYQHVTKQDDRVSQRHELIGTKRIY